MSHHRITMSKMPPATNYLTHEMYQEFPRTVSNISSEEEDRHDSSLLHRSPMEQSFPSRRASWGGLTAATGHGYYSYTHLPSHPYYHPYVPAHYSHGEGLYGRPTTPTTEYQTTAATDRPVTNQHAYRSSPPNVENSSQLSEKEHSNIQPKQSPHEMAALALLALNPTLPQKKRPPLESEPNTSSKTTRRRTNTQETTKKPSIVTSSTIADRLAMNAAYAKPSKKACKCKNTRCLKLYCACFQGGDFCNPEICRCSSSCANNWNENRANGLRYQALHAILRKNPKAFQIQGPRCNCNKSR